VKDLSMINSLALLVFKNAYRDENPGAQCSHLAALDDEDFAHLEATVQRMATACEQERRERDVRRAEFTESPI
jgi:hypothetical protein